MASTRKCRFLTPPPSPLNIRRIAVEASWHADRNHCCVVVRWLDPELLSLSRHTATVPNFYSKCCSLQESSDCQPGDMMQPANLKKLPSLCRFDSCRMVMVWLEEREKCRLGVCCVALNAIRGFVHEVLRIGGWYQRCALRVCIGMFTQEIAATRRAQRGSFLTTVG